jgi:hypothetical protein
MIYVQNIDKKPSRFSEMLRVPSVASLHFTKKIFIKNSEVFNGLLDLEIYAIRKCFSASLF